MKYYDTINDGTATPLLQEGGLSVDGTSKNVTNKKGPRYSKRCTTLLGIIAAVAQALEQYILQNIAIFVIFAIWYCNKKIFCNIILQYFGILQYLLQYCPIYCNILCNIVLLLILLSLKILASRMLLSKNVAGVS